uniref:Uncharacterized protein n=1 Tax=Schlesneria paludicola TaxID=360056 RepID=A0A7C4LMW3_9PLAN
MTAPIRELGLSLKQRRTIRLRRGRCRPGWGVCLLVAGPLSSLLGAAEPADAARPKQAPSAAPASSTPDAQARRIIEQMQAAHEKLSRKDAGPETQAIQKEVLAALDELLKAPPQQNPQSSPQGGGGSAAGGAGQAGSRSRSDPDPAPPDQQPQQTVSESSGKANGAVERNRQNAEDAIERTGTAPTVDQTALRRRRLEVDVWGHLPEKLREQLLSTYGEKVVPQYEDLVRRFYEALSEPSPADPLAPRRR